VSSAKELLVSGRNLFLVYFRGVFGFQLIDMK